MFSGFKNFVSELEASVAQTLPRPVEGSPALQQAAGSPTVTRTASSSNQAPQQSAAQLADSALSSLRSSLKRGARGTSDVVPRASADTVKSAPLRSHTTSTPPSREAVEPGPPLDIATAPVTSASPTGGKSISRSGQLEEDDFSLGSSHPGTPDRAATPLVSNVPLAQIGSEAASSSTAAAKAASTFENAPLPSEVNEPPPHEMPVPSKHSTTTQNAMIATSAASVDSNVALSEATTNLPRDPFVDMQASPRDILSPLPTTAVATMGRAAHDPRNHVDPHPIESSGVLSDPLSPIVAPTSTGMADMSVPRTSLDAYIPSRPSLDASVEALVDPRIAVDEPRQPNLLPAYKRLQAEKIAVEAIINNQTPLAGLSDLEAFEDYLKNLVARADLSMAEVKRLAIAHDQQSERVDEMRDTHRLEVKSQSSQIDQLRQQLEARDLAIKGFETERTKAGETTTSSNARIASLEKDLERANTATKEEEEKRIKSVSLLKALRQKLVKAEKDKEEAERERDAAKQSESGAIGRLESDVANLRALQEQQLNKLRISYEREATLVRAQYEREAAARRGQAELEGIAIRAGHQKELATRDARLRDIEKIHRDVLAERDSNFERSQLHQAEAESAREQQDQLASRTNELEIQLREARDRMAALIEELEHTKRLHSASAGPSSDETQAARALLAEAETAHLQRVSSLQERIRQLERERVEAEEEMSRQLQDRLREVERMRAEMTKKDAEFAGSMQTRDERQAKLDSAEARNHELAKKSATLELMLEDSRAEIYRAQEHEAVAREESHEHERRVAELESRQAELQLTFATLKSANKTLREELRKVQTGMLMSDKQRNPGVGYFSHAGTQPPLECNGVRSPVSETITSPGPILAPPPANAEEAINFEYIRNVILQFLEHKDMRTHLVGVLGVILHFTPQELRRLVAKANA